MINTDSERTSSSNIDDRKLKVESIDILEIEKKKIIKQLPSQVVSLGQNMDQI